MESVKQALSTLQAGDDNSFTQIRMQYDALLSSMVSKCISVYHYDAEYDDLMQEATLALYNAAMSYDVEQSEVTFGLYAKVCIRNRLISAGRKLKRQQKNRTVSEIRQESDRTQKRSAAYAQIDSLREVLSESFSQYERTVFELYLGGCSYKEMAEKLNKTEKSIDNAVCRMKNKLKKHFIRDGD